MSQASPRISTARARLYSKARWVLATFLPSGIDRLNSESGLPASRYVPHPVALYVGAPVEERDEQQTIQVPCVVVFSNGSTIDETAGATGGYAFDDVTLTVRAVCQSRGSGTIAAANNAEFMALEAAACLAEFLTATDAGTSINYARADSTGTGSITQLGDDNYRVSFEVGVSVRYSFAQPVTQTVQPFTGAAAFEPGTFAPPVMALEFVSAPVPVSVSPGAAVTLPASSYDASGLRLTLATGYTPATALCARQRVGSTYSAALAGTPATGIVTPSNLVALSGDLWTVSFQHPTLFVPWSYIIRWS